MVAQVVRVQKCWRGFQVWCRIFIDERYRCANLCSHDIRVDEELDKHTRRKYFSPLTRYRGCTIGGIHAGLGYAHI